MATTGIVHALRDTHHTQTVRAHMKNTTLSFFLTLVFSIFLLGCSSRYSINKVDYKLNPYTGNEILVFESSKNNRDTIFLKGVENFYVRNDPLAFFPDKYELYEVRCTRSDPNYDRYLDGKMLFALGATSKEETRLRFEILLKGSWYYTPSSFLKHEFDSIPNQKLVINQTEYDDVKIILADDNYEHRDNYVKQFYWSVSKGFLGLDKKDEQWRLVKIYVP